MEKVWELLKWNGGGLYSSGVGIGCIDFEGKVHPDQFWQMQGNMTVFGFGRLPHEHPGTYMEEVPVHLTIGFVESTRYDEITKHIRAAIINPQIKVGKIQKLVL